MNRVRGLAFLALTPLSLLAQEAPPRLLNIVQEQLKPNVEAKYSRIEEAAARVCAVYYPNSYLALESVTGPRGANQTPPGSRPIRNSGVPPAENG